MHTIGMDLGTPMLAVLDPMIQLECAVTHYSWVKVQPIRLVLKSCWNIFRFYFGTWLNFSRCSR